MSLDFVAIDFETANGSPASPCAVGLVRVRGGKIVDGFESMFKPPALHNWFSAGNIAVHGITPSMIQSAPDYSEVLSQMLEFVAEDVLIAHNAPFDMGVLRASASAIGSSLPNLRYSCSLQIARKTYNLESYRLNQVAYAVGHEEFDHHNALADSDACSRIVIHAADRHGARNLDELLIATKLSLKQL
jgi:DNA polymerase III, epsilon subunit and related 3''-5'' exonucleases